MTTQCFSLSFSALHLPILLFRQCALSCLIVLLYLITPNAQAQSNENVRDELHLFISRMSTLPQQTKAREYQSELDRFYSAINYAPVWFDQGRPKPDVNIALNELHSAPDHGLSASTYNFDWLTQEIQAISKEKVNLPARLAHIETALTIALLRYANHLHYGRTHSPYLSRQTKKDTFDRVEWLRVALTQNKLSSAITEAEPTHPFYKQLKDILIQYRKLSQSPWPTLPALPDKAKVEPGEHYSGVAALYDKLLVLGDISSASPRPSSDIYEESVVEGVKHFQERHGLTADGIFGKQSFLELNKPLEERVHQLELTLERLRWLPRFSSEPHILVNIPSYSLFAFSDNHTSQPTLAMRVIVGKSKQTPTPIFNSAMQQVEFNPYWHVPQSILREEIVPKLEEDPTYLQHKGMELAGGEDTEDINEDVLEALQKGQLRVRQKPGSKNALGRIKFILPNAMDIYLHATPSVRLFERARRDFSHGCIRVEHPVELAQFVLHNPQSWSADHIKAAMSSKKTHRVRLPSPIPIFIFYSTAMVDEHGHVLFFPDIYHHDEKLSQDIRR